MMGDIALLYQSMSMKLSAATPACGTSPALRVDVAAHDEETPEDDDTRSCISNFTRSIGATAVLANAPAAAPATASRIEARTNERRRSFRRLVASFVVAGGVIIGSDSAADYLISIIEYDCTADER